MVRTILALLFFLPAIPALAADLTVRILYLERRTPPPPALSNLDPIPEDLGLAGAMLGVADSNTTGKFLGHSYTLETMILDEEADLAEAIAALGPDAPDLILAKAPADDLLALADLPSAAEALIFNVGAADVRLRRADCRANLLHTLPSRAMLADAIAQFLVKKRWTRWFLVQGPSDGDRLYAEALRAAAKKFNTDIVADKPWPFAADMRRSAGAEAPAFTQVDAYDILLATDEAGDYARYLQYNTWDPRPIGAGAGLIATGWSRVVEQWGAAQLQGRFVEQSDRAMQDVDYAAWAAVRAISTAVTRASVSEAPAIRAFLLSDAFELGGFKGRKLSFRGWNGQLRQPIPLTSAGALVAQAPLDGFLHPKSEMDTLGYDRGVAGCTAFE